MPLDRALLCQEKLQKVMTEERMYLFRLQNTPTDVSQYAPQWTYSPSPNSQMSNSTTSYVMNSYSATPIPSPLQSPNLPNFVESAVQNETNPEQSSQDILSQALSTIDYQ